MKNDAYSTSGLVFPSSSYHANPDESFDHHIHSTSGWQWYSASQIPSVSPVLRPIIPDSHQSKDRWQEQHLALTSSKHTNPFLVRNDLPSSDPLHRVCTHTQAHTVLSPDWSIPSISSMRRTYSSRTSSGKYPDSCRNHSTRTAANLLLRIIGIDPISGTCRHEPQLPTNRSGTSDKVAVKYKRFLF